MMADETVVSLALNGDEHAALANALAFRMDHLAKQPPSSERTEEMCMLASITIQALKQITQRRWAELN